MALDSTKYREYLHQVRSHPPSSSSPTLVNSKILLISLTLFLILELGFEWQWDDYPAGLLFPFGYLIFWALLYSFQFPTKKGALTKTSHSLLQDLSQNLGDVFSLFTPSPSISSPVQKRKPQSAPRGTELPKDIENALGLLGLKGCRDWKKIHKRYRELAKKFHPDLNPDLTQTGNRFIIYDGAYRKLSAVKEKYFSPAMKD